MERAGVFVSKLVFPLIAAYDPIGIEQRGWNWSQGLELLCLLMLLS